MRRVKCYDNGGTTADRFTVVWLKPMIIDYRKYWVVASMSTDPTHPQGVWGTSELKYCPDYSSEQSEIGKRIPFKALPLICQQLINNYWED